MDLDDASLLEIEFAGEVIEWRGPAPFVFVVIPETFYGEIRWAAREASYGWGVVPVTAVLGGVRYTSSLFPRDGAYLLPVKVTVRRQVELAIGDRVEVAMRIDRKGGMLRRAQDERE